MPLNIRQAVYCVWNEWCEKHSKIKWTQRSGGKDKEVLTPGWLS